MLIPPSITAPDTLKGVDDLIRSGFEQFSELWFRRLLEATALVAIGLLLELPEIWHESVEAIKELLGCGAEKRIRPWAKLFGTVGWILIVGGVCGEFWAESFTSRADGFIRKFDEILLAEANRNAGAAAESARIAHAEVIEVRKISDQAKFTSGQALDKSNSANVSASKALSTSKAATDAANEAQEQIDDIAERADELDRKIWQTQLWLSARTVVNLDSLPDTLKKFKGKEIVLASYIGDPEAERVCDALFNAAALAEMKPTNRCAKEPLSVPVQTGTLIFGPDDNEIKEFMHIIAQVVSGGAGAMFPQPGSTLTVLVGKLEPFTMDSRQLFNPPPIRERIKRQHKKP